MLDTLTLADRLTDAGVEQKQANAIAHAIHDAQGETVTKGDIQHLATKADLERFATRADLERCATKTDIATIETQMAAMESRLAWRVVGAVAVIGAILRFVG
jgi:hypothetical protein